MSTALRDINAQLSLDGLVSMSPDGTDSVWALGDRFLNFHYAVSYNATGLTVTLDRFAVLESANPAGSYEWAASGPLFRVTYTFGQPLDFAQLQINTATLVRGNDKLFGHSTASDVLLGGRGNDK